MTISGYVQSFSFASVRLSVTARSSTDSTTAPSAFATPAAADRLTLSPTATAGAGVHEPVDGAADAPGVPPVPGVPAVPGALPVPGAPPAPSRTDRRAEALFDALDADKDGSITEQEFTEGAIALLRRAGNRHRVRNNSDDDGGGRESRGVRRLERTIEKAFGRLDANDDGAIDKDELTSALAQVAGRRRGVVEPPHAPEAPPTTSAPGTPPPPGAPGAAPPPGPAPAQDAQTRTGTIVTFSFTYVSVAVQRYTSLQPPTAASLDAARKATDEVPTQTPAKQPADKPASASVEHMRAA